MRFLRKWFPKRDEPLVAEIKTNLAKGSSEARKPLFIDGNYQGRTALPHFQTAVRPGTSVGTGMVSFSSSAPIYQQYCDCSSSMLAVAGVAAAAYTFSGGGSE